MGPRPRPPDTQPLLVGATRCAEKLERQERSKNAKGPDKKYAQLEEEGLEDDEELVDKATVRDRAWDDWTDENPKGIGNKAGKLF